MALNEGQIVTLAVDEIIETISAITPMAQKAKKYTPPAASMQRSSNTIWMPVEQESPTQEGWDLTDKATGLLELNVAVNMGEPDNDFFSYAPMTCETRLRIVTASSPPLVSWRTTLS